MHLGLSHERVSLTVCVSVCVCVCAIESSSSSVSGLKRLWDEWEQRIKERLHVWPCIILDILNAAFVEMGTAYKKWHCAAAERACGLNSMTNLSLRIILFNLPPTLCLRHFCYTQYLWVEWTILKIFKRRLLGPMHWENKKRDPFVSVHNLWLKMVLRLILAGRAKSSAHSFWTKYWKECWISKGKHLIMHKRIPFLFLASVTYFTLRTHLHTHACTKKRKNIHIPWHTHTCTKHKFTCTIHSLHLPSSLCTLCVILTGKKDVTYPLWMTKPTSVSTKNWI